MAVEKSNRVLFLLLTLVAFVSSQTPSFPKFEDNFATQVEFTLFKYYSNESQTYTTTSHEYHDIKEGRGVVNPGLNVIEYYFLKLNQAITIGSDKRCFGYKLNETTNPSMQFWITDNNKDIVGSSGILRHYTPVFEKTETVRKISCDKFVAKDGNMNIAFYIADKNWLNSSGIDYPVPVRVTFNGTRPLNGKEEPLEGQMDFVSYQLVDKFGMESLLKIPHGLGCTELMKDMKNLHPDKVFPKIKNEVSFTMELLDIKKNEADFFVNLAKLWFHSVSHIVRVEGYDADFVPYNEIQDYNTGVNYRIYRNDSCFLSPIQNRETESHKDGFMGKMKTAAEFLSMDSEYIYLGMELYRSLNCEVWETVFHNKTLGGIKYPHVVYTYYIAAPKIEIVSSGDANVQVPVALIISAFKGEMHLEPEATALYNIFNFDEAEEFAFLREIDLSLCYEEESSKNYFTVRFGGNAPEVVRDVALYSASFEYIAALEISDAAKVSVTRIPKLQISIEGNDIVAFGLILDRPSALAGFILYNEEGFAPTADMLDQMTSVNNAEECAQFCLGEENFKCRIFSLCNQPADCSTMQDCKFRCFIGKQDIDSKFEKPLPGQFDCKLFARAVSEEGIKDLELPQALKALNKSISLGQLTVDFSPNETQHLFKATKFETGLKPFNDFNHELLYETSFAGFQLKDSSGSQATQEVYMQVPSSERCYEHCRTDSRLSCASFSYCPINGRCRLSSKYLTVDDKESVKHIEAASDCRVYRKRDFDFFEGTPGKVAKITGKKTLQNVADPQSCAFWCKSEKSLSCKSYEYCPDTKSCELHDFHHFQEIEMQPGEKEFCNRYHLKYSAEFNLSPGFQIVIDPKATQVRSTSFEECAKTCFENSASCRSINFCPGEMEQPNTCVLNTVAIYDENVERIISDTCQHYSSRISHIDPEIPLFVAIPNLVTNGYQATIEVTKNLFLNKTQSYVVNEYHDLQRNRGRVDRMDLGGGKKVTWFYFTDTRQVVNISGSDCRVESFDDPNYFQEANFWKDIQSDDFIAGPSGVLYRPTSGVPTFTAADVIVRGVPCYKFSAVDAVDDKVNIDYFVPITWKTSDDKPFPYPIRVVADGIDKQGRRVNVQVDITNFIPSVPVFDRFQIPPGIGCRGLKYNGIRKLPTVEDQFSFTSESYNYYKAKLNIEGHVLLFKVWFDALNKIVRVDGVDETFAPIQRIYDFSTGVQYDIREYNECQLGGIKNSPASGGQDGVVRFMKDGNSLLGLNGDYYYLGKGLARNVYCDVWETVKDDIVFSGISYFRVVQTVYFQSPEILGVANDDMNIQVPVKIEMRMQQKANSPVMLMENNIYNFDEAEGRLFYNEINLERCFTREEEKDNFMVYFPAQGTSVDQRNENRQRMEIEARLSISKAAGISIVRISYIQVKSDKNNVVVLGTLLEKPPPLAGFYLFSTKEEPFTSEIPVTKVIKEEGDCAVECLSKGTCKGFTYCPGDLTKPIRCFLTTLDVGDSNWGEINPDDKRECSLYFRSAMNTTMSEPDLKTAMKNLDANVKAGKVQMGIRIKDKPVVYLTANRIEEQLNPFNFEDKDLFDMIFTQRRLDTGSETVIDKDMALSASECYQLCQDEESMFCSSFSYCKNSGNCRLSSEYIDPDVAKTQQDVEEGTATGCTVFRRSSIKFFERMQGLTSKATGDKFVDNMVSPDQCALTCRQEKSFTCRGFEYCDNKQQAGCVLHKTHTFDIGTNPGVPICSHYHLKFGLEFADMGKFELVGPGQPIKTTMESFDVCSKLCYELGSNCLSFNYCPGETELSSSCSLLAADTDTPGYELNPSEKCSHFFRKSKVQVKRPVIVIETNRVSGGHFAGVSFGVLIFGAFLGAVGFILLSLYKSRHQNADGTSVRYVKNP